MTYVMSDIHGEYAKYIAMLDKIGFSDKDELYILGDVIDRGAQPLHILRDMMLRANVFPVIGNHEAMCYYVLSRIGDKLSEDTVLSSVSADVADTLSSWIRNGGGSTLREFCGLSDEEKADICEYLGEFADYETAEIADRKYILVHSGLGNFSKEKKLSEYELDELCEQRPDYSKRLFDDREIICGHTPTLAISGKPEIYKSEGYINIDCGAFYDGGKLACLRLDDLSEFYI